MKQFPAHTVLAPEIYGDFWFNSGPLTIHAMHGQVILLCFWDYTSDASLQLVKHVQEWHQLYADMGLVVIGIHSPEFSFARDPKLVEAVIHRLGLQFPVATDNTLMLRDAYRVQELPTLCLVERDGSIYLSHSGDGAYERTERAIQTLLREAGFHGELPLLMELSRTDGFLQSSFHRPTPTIRTGYLHGSLGNVEGYSPELPADYSDAHVYVEGKFYAQGNWSAKSDAFEYEGAANEGYVTLRYAGNNVGAVIAAEKKGSIVQVLHDGKAMAIHECGDDITIDDHGNTIVVVNEPKLFQVIRNKEFSDHIVKIVPMEKGTTLYSFTFDANPVAALKGAEKKSYRNN
jgi:hypothetical protein